ncbi:hypothetical protein GCM10017673_29580 [Streptosporangium violaceochromogenes]|nr:hypothetical protein GCM10017673_29580 [Streptosporangium violaceochromogenes]
MKAHFRLSPTPGQRVALAKAFGCARTVFNDGLRIRRDAREQGLPYISDGDLSKRDYASEADPGTRLAGRGVRRGPSAGARRPEHRVPQLLRLDLREMARTKPAKSVHDAGWSRFVGTTVERR